MSQEPRVIVVAGLDPSGGAGLLADADAIRAAGGRPLLCASATTVQTTSAVRGYAPIPTDVVLEQIRALAEEEGPIGAMKLGMLATRDMARAMGSLAKERAYTRIPWVVDPVLRSSSGAEMVEGAEAAYASLLLPHVILTPNLAEAAALAGRPLPKGEKEMLACAEVLLWRGAGAVLVKGGHLQGEAFDLFVTPSTASRIEGPRLVGDRRGTGCRLASFLAGRLAGGAPVEEALVDAKAAVAAYLERGKLPNAQAYS